MCFASQRRTLLRHLNFQKWSEHGLFCTFWLGNVLRATSACNFSSVIWPAGSTPTALASLLFDPPEPQIIRKNTGNRDSPTFSRTCLFFLPSLSPLWSSHLLASPLWLFPPLLFHLSILSEVWPLNFLRLISSPYYYHPLIINAWGSFSIRVLCLLFGVPNSKHKTLII